MELQIIEKGQKFELDIVSKQEGPKNYYFGAGWDNPNGPVDLDIVCALLVGGKLDDNANFVYFGNRNAPGVALSEDNTTGEGEGDDESIVICPADLADNVDKVVIGLVAYAGADLSSAPNPHFRVCDGEAEESSQIGDVKISGTAEEGSTVLTTFAITKGDNGWELENIEAFYKMGAGQSAIQGFGSLFD